MRIPGYWNQECTGYSHKTRKCYITWEMAMKLAVKETAEARGFRNAKELADRLGISYNSIYPLWQGTAKRIDLATLSKLCRGLQANAGLLLIYQPSADDDSEQAPESTRAAAPRGKGRG